MAWICSECRLSNGKLFHCPQEQEAISGRGPKLFVGMPSATGGAGDPKYYRKPDEVAKIYEVCMHSLNDKKVFEVCAQS